MLASVDPLSDTFSYVMHMHCACHSIAYEVSMSVPGGCQHLVHRVPSLSGDQKHDNMPSTIYLCMENNSSLY
jgi:hypothetical protein